MNQVLENLFIVGCILAVILIPACLAVIRSRKLKKQKISRELKAAEQARDLSFHHVDEVDDFILALDPVRKKLIRMSHADFAIGQFDLEGLDSCVLIEIKRGDTLQLLQLGLHDKDQKLSHIVFYKQYQGNDWHLKRTIRLAEKWKDLIQNVIRPAA